MSKQSSGSAVGRWYPKSNGGNGIGDTGGRIWAAAGGVEGGNIGESAGCFVWPLGPVYLFGEGGRPVGMRCSRQGELDCDDGKLRTTAGRLPHSVASKLTSP